MNKENIDITNVILKTNRLVLRTFKLTDLDDFYEYASVEGVGEMTGWKHHENKETSLEILNLFIKEKKTFAFVYDNKVIGSLGIAKYNEDVLKKFESKLGRELGFFYQNSILANKSFALSSKSPIK